MIGVYCVSVSVVIMSMSVNIFVKTFIFLSNPMLCVCSSLNMLQKKPPEVFYKKNCNFIKKETDTGVFLWILRNFEERIFYSKSTVIMRWCVCLCLWTSICVRQKVVIRRCSTKKVFLKISQNSPENTCARVSFLWKELRHSCFLVNFTKFSRTFSYELPPGHCFWHKIFQKHLLIQLIEICTHILPK